MVHTASHVALVLALCLSVSYVVDALHVQEHVAKFEQPVPQTTASVGPFREWLRLLVFEVPDQVFPVDSNGCKGTVYMYNLTCRNISLDSIKSSRNAHPPGVEIDLDGVGLECNTTIATDLTYKHLPLKYNFSVDLALSHTSVDYAVVFPVDTDGLPLGANCTKAVVNVPQPKLNIHFNNGVPQWLQALLDPVVDGILEKNIPPIFHNLVAPLLVNLTNTNLTNVIKNISEQIRPYMKQKPFPHPVEILPNAIDLRNNSVAAVVDEILDRLLSPGGKYSIDAIIDHFTSDTGEVNFTLDKHVSLPINGLATFDIGIEGVKLGGLDTFQVFEVLDVVGPVDAISHTNMSDFSAGLTVTINLTADDGPVSDIPLLEQFMLTLNLKRPNLRAMTEIALNRSLLQSDMLLDIISDPDCILTNVLNLSTVYLGFDMQAEDVLVVPVGGNLEEDVDAVINNFVGLLFDSFSVAVPGLLDYELADPLVDIVNKLMEDAVASATCVMKNHTNHTDPSDGNFGLPTTPDVFPEALIAIFSGASAASILFAIVAWKCKTNRQPASIYDEPQRLLNQQEHGHEDDGGGGGPLLLHPDISWFARSMVITGIIFTSAMFAASNDSLGAKVYITLTLDDERFRPPSLFDFGLVNTVRDMWNGGVYPLSIIVAVFSGAWPHLKVVLMGMCWCTPSRRLSVQRRESIMMVLDALGKWSLIDSFLMTLFLVAFKFDIEENIDGLTPGKYITGSAKVEVVPMFGYHGFIASTIMTLIMNHILLYYHRLVVRPPIAITNLKDDYQSVSSHVYLRRHQRMVFTSCGKVTVAVVLLGAATLVGAGVYYISFSFIFDGAAGWFLGDDNIRSYSVLTLADALSNSSQYAGSGALMFIQAMFLSFTVIFPLAQLVTMLYLWLVPMRLTAQKRVFHVAEVLNAWAALDVFVFALIASILEISQFAQFIVGDKCDAINALLKKYFDKQLHGDDKCFDLTTTLGNGCWLLFVAAVVQAFLGGGILRLCHTAVGQRSYGSKLSMNAPDENVRNAIAGISFLLRRY